MTHPFYHARSSVRLWGGQEADYLPVHEWLDATKESFCDFRHRALRHHAEGIFEAERIFGQVIVNSDGRAIPVRYVAEQHVREDCGGKVPTLADWLSRIQPAPWMAHATKSVSGEFGNGTRRGEDTDDDAGIASEDDAGDGGRLAEHVAGAEGGQGAGGGPGAFRPG